MILSVVTTPVRGTFVTRCDAYPDWRHEATVYDPGAIERALRLHIFEHTPLAFYKQERTH